MDSEKHTRYLSSYQPNDYFWGIGIENETYLQFTKAFAHPTLGIHQNHKQERYSVNYYNGLNPEYKNHIQYLFPLTNSHYPIPIYLNGHSLQKTDVSGNHQTTYEKEPKPNINYKGKSIHETLCAFNPEEFANKYKISYTFDGDTIEFMTQNYYKSTIEEAIDELISIKKLFLNSINDAFQSLSIFTKYGMLQYPKRNEPFVSFLTNTNNIAIFNNGTYHINITLPTQLDSDSQPINEEYFVKSHRNLIRFIQFLEPFLIVKYGTPDPFSKVSSKYSKASQRCAVSRYIGIGTYDTETMMTGKILTIPIDEFPQSKITYWWYNEYNKKSNYKPLDKIGVDINFRKHGVHGIEIRFFEWFPECDLKPLLTLLVHLCDFSLDYDIVENPIFNPIWNYFIVRCLTNGPELELQEDEYNLFHLIFDIKKRKSSRKINDVFDQIESRILEKKGICVNRMLRPKKTPLSRMKWIM